MHASVIMNNAAVTQTAEIRDQTGQKILKREKKWKDRVKSSKPVCLLWWRFSWSDREKLWPQSVKSHWYGFSPGHRQKTRIKGTPSSAHN